MPTPIAEEQPPCGNCGHRRIHHYVIVNNVERRARCNVFTDNPHNRGCGCMNYEPYVPPVTSRDRFLSWWNGR